MELQTSSNQARYRYQMSQLLQNNNQKLQEISGVKGQLEKGSSSIFKAISFKLFFTKDYEKEVKQRCINLLQELKKQQVITFKQEITTKAQSILL